MLLKAVFLMALTSSGSCTNFHTYDKQVASPCDSSHYLDNMAAVASAALKAPAASVQKALEQAGQMSVLAAQLDGPERTAAQLTAAMAIIQGAAAIESTLRQWDNIITGMVAASKLAATAALVDELAETTTTDIAAKTTGTITPATDMSVQAKLKPNELGFCKQAADALKQTKTADNTHSSTKTITAYALKPTPKASDATRGENMVCLLTGANTVSGQTCGTTATAVGYRGGKLLAALKIQLSKDSASKEQKYQPSQESSILPDKATINELTTQIAAMEAAAAKLTMANTVSPEASVIDTATEDAIARYLKGDKADYRNHKNDVDKFISANFGENGKNIKEQLGPKVDQMKPTKAATGGTGTAKLTDLTSTEELHKAQLYYAVASLVRDKEEKKKSQASPSCPTKTEKAEETKKTADECKKHAEEKACKDEKGCEFDEKKPEGERCFPKVYTEKKDEKSFSSNLRVSLPQVFAAFVAFLF
uniref:Variant surface glycoprotein 1125.379 n=1 Tax=Trypanosoma brucei TaxID=5691 RepID=A0A1J0R5T7_9TRYP|nr:variant surface glycoprotein 1125.379 [Trypanosoma brucei]